MVSDRVRNRTQQNASGAAAPPQISDVWLVSLQVNEYDKQFSAYMLFYERADELEPIDQLRQVSHPAADAALPSAAAAAPPASAPALSAAAEAPAESTTAASTSAPSEPIFSMLVDVRARHPLP